jgi:hypothetical protein
MRQKRDLTVHDDCTLAFPPEFQMLFCCARAQRDERHSERIDRLIRAGLDWDRLVDVARWHGVLPLLHWHLDQICPDAVPGLHRSVLQACFSANAGRAAFQTGELLRVLRILEHDNVPAIPYKGVALAQSLFGRIDLREAGDLDVIVRPGDLEHVTQLLLMEGYLPLHVSRNHRANTRGIPHRAFEHKLHGTLLELHWGIAGARYGFADDLDRMWDRLNCTTLAGATIRTFTPDDLLLILSLHGAKHVWERIKWVCDIAQLLDCNPNGDWDRAVERAADLGERRIVLLALCLANGLLDAELPKTVAATVRAETALASLRNRVFATLLESRTPGLRRSLRYVIFPLLVRERLRDRGIYAFSLVKRLVVHFPNTLGKACGYALQTGRRTRRAALPAVGDRRHA